MSIKRRKLVYTLVLIALFVALAGCGLFINTQSEPQPGTSVVDLQLTFSNTTQGYAAEGSLDIEYATDEEIVFRDVTLCTYDSSGELLASPIVGDYSSGGTRQNVSIETSVKPEYIFPEHPAFREHGISPEIFDWSSDRPRLTSASPSEYIDEFNYSPPRDSGSCGEAD